jgi:1,4-alpha-glucan branching enzyme
MSAIGAFTFVLHSHLPYARLAGRWPHGEEWIHEAASETYIPLLNALYDLRDEGVRYKITIGLHLCCRTVGRRTCSITWTSI